LLPLRLKSLQNIGLLLLLLLELLLLVGTLLNGRCQQLGILGRVFSLSILSAKLLCVNVAGRLSSVSRLLDVTIQKVRLGELAKGVGTDQMALAEKLGVETVNVVQDIDTRGILTSRLQNGGDVAL
jgi:hypothetical protein